jgi:hypothetical protein
MSRLSNLHFLALGTCVLEDRAICIGAVTLAPGSGRDASANDHVLVEWRDPVESYGLSATLALAASLARQGERVTMILIRDSVAAAAKGEHTFWFAELHRLGVDVMADLASLRARGIPIASLSAWVRPTVVTPSLNALVEDPDADRVAGNAFGRLAFRSVEVET